VDLKIKLKSYEHECLFFEPQIFTLLAQNAEVIFANFSSFLTKKIVVPFKNTTYIEIKTSKKAFYIMYY